MAARAARLHAPMYSNYLAPLASSCPPRRLPCPQPQFVGVQRQSDWLVDPHFGRKGYCCLLFFLLA